MTGNWKACSFLLPYNFLNIKTAYQFLNTLRRDSRKQLFNKFLQVAVPMKMKFVSEPIET